jgi:cytochrome c5
MDNNPDKHFFDLFMIVIGGLVAVSFALFLLSNYIAGNTQEVYVLQDNRYQETVSSRLTPVSHVALDGETLENAGEVATIEPVAEVLSGPQVYNQACVACHGAGVAGAPKTGDAAAWGSRIVQDKTTLSDHVINGYQGAAGYMPPKGGRADLSDDEILSAMAYMLDQVR